MSNNIEKKVISHIKKFGSMSFSFFMEEALYRNQESYYANSKKKFGDGGDFITASGIAQFFTDSILTILEKMSEQVEMHILELGPGDGRMGLKIIKNLEEKNIKYKYFFLEISDELVQLQKKNIKELFMEHVTSKKILWLKHIPQNFSGVVIGNEFLDALPFNIYEKKGKLFEKIVAIDSNERLHFKSIPCNNFGLKNKVDYLKHDFIFEYVDYSNYLKEILKNFAKGFVFFIDYGHAESEYFNLNRSNGSFRFFHQHKLVDSPFDNIGNQDITADVNFSDLYNLFYKSAFDLHLFTNQREMIVKTLNISNELSNNDRVRLNTLIHPNEMGEKFKVMIFGKEVEPISFFNKFKDLSYQL